MTQALATIPGASVEQYEAPLFIAWQINAECNLNCFHCCEEAGMAFPDQMSKAQMLDLCAQIVKAQIPYVALSGGEPLICPHFWDVLEYLRKNNVSVKIETNGEFIDEKVARRLGALTLRSVQISMDGATAKSHEALRERGNWQKVIRACKLLRDTSANIEIVFVPTRFNIHEVGEAVDLAASLQAHGFYTGKLMRIGRAAQNWQKLCPSDDQYREFFAVLEQKKALYLGRMKVFNYPYDVIEELRYRLEAPAASLLVLPNGKVKLIGPLPFICGDVTVMPLTQVWRNYKKAWKDKRVTEFASRVLKNPALVAEANRWREL
ncbi:MAG: radical SAM protein [Lentisphaerae bacterium]|nr:radical SAM protein [Lentisphaerota bacterium]